MCTKILIPTVLLLLMVISSGIPSGESYFPDAEFEESFSKELTAMNEPSLYAFSKDKAAHIYRFLWLRTFNNPIALRLSVDPEGTGLITIKILSGESGYELGTLSTNESVPVDTHAVSEFLKHLDNSMFWKLPSHEETDEIRLDGAVWLMEGARSGKYHVVNRWSPDKGSFRKAALYLLQVSRLRIKEIY